MNTILNLSRREFLKTTGLASGGLLLSLSGVPLTANAGTGSFDLAPYINIMADGSISLGVPSSELGQGVHTSLATILAEELEIEMDQVSSVKTIHHPAFKNPMIKELSGGVMHTQTTGGSWSVAGFYVPLRKMGATAREMLRAAAAENWSVPIDQCRASGGKITNTATGKSLGYGELAAAAARQPMPEDPQLKAPDTFRLIGQPLARLDTPAKVNGSAVYGNDVDLPGMLYATVKQIPVFGAKLSSVDDSAAKAVTGVIAVIPLENMAIVVAENTWAAFQGADALVLHTTGGDASFSDNDISTRQKDSFAVTGAPVAREGDADGVIAVSDKTIESEYGVSLQSHATLEPQCATAHITADGCDLWVPTQGQDNAIFLAMMITELPPEKIRVHTTFVGGGYGRKFANDQIIPTLIAAKATGQPVKLTYSRTEDMQHDFYLPPMRVRMRAALDATGVPKALSAKLVGPSPSAPFAAAMGTFFPPWMREDGFDWGVCIGMFDFETKAGTYAIPDLKVDYTPTEIPVPVGFWRGIGTVHNAFALESWMDEVAHTSGIDPIELRRQLLKNTPRALGVLDKIEEVTNWGGPLPEGHHRGMGYIYYLHSYQAQVAEVSVDKRGKVKVHRVTCVIDCGEAVNPAIIESQIQGAIIYGLSGTIKGRINIENGRVVQGNFDDYPLPLLKDAPRIDVHIINSHKDPSGIGEAGVPLVGPIVANAVFAATGKRVRRLPIARSDLI